MSKIRVKAFIVKTINIKKCVSIDDLNQSLIQNSIIKHSPILRIFDHYHKLNIVLLFWRDLENCISYNVFQFQLNLEGERELHLEIYLISTKYVIEFDSIQRPGCDN